MEVSTARLSPMADSSGVVCTLMPSRVLSLKWSRGIFSSPPFNTTTRRAPSVFPSILLSMVIAGRPPSGLLLSCRTIMRRSSLANSRAALVVAMWTVGYQQYSPTLERECKYLTVLGSAKMDPTQTLVSPRTFLCRGRCAIHLFYGLRNFELG